MPPPKPKIRKLTTITKFVTAKPTPTVTATPSLPTTSTVTDSFTVTADVHRADVPNEAADDIVTASVSLSSENVSYTTCSNCEGKMVYFVYDDFTECIILLCRVWQ